MCSDILNAMFGIINENPFTTAIQITGKILVLSAGDPGYVSWLAMIWSMSDVIRYASRVNGSPFVAKLSRSQYKVLYPLGIVFEIISLLTASKRRGGRLGIIVMYAIFVPRVFNHASKEDTYRHIRETLAKYAEIEPSDFKIKCKGTTYHLTFKNVSKVRNLFTGARFKWKETEMAKEYVLGVDGIQVPRRLVYFIQSIAILLAYPYAVGNVMRIDVVLWILHYGKCVFESAFTHRFASDTMPLVGTFENSIDCWGIGRFRQ